jgi:hypothetical protein
MRWPPDLTRVFRFLTDFDDALDWPDDALLDDAEDLGVVSWGVEPAPAPLATGWAA